MPEYLSRRQLLLALGPGVAAALSAPGPSAHGHATATFPTVSDQPATPSLDGSPPAADTRRPALTFDAVAAKQRARLAVFGAWCRTHGVRGHIGEVGWPSDRDGSKYDARWNMVGEAWFRDAARWGLTTTYWAAGEWYLEFGPYVSVDGGLRERTSVAAVFEANLRPGSGVNMSGGEFTPQARPGRLWTDYNLPTESSLRFLASRGVSLIRLPVAWERLQPRLRGPLNGKHTAEIRQVLATAATHGMTVLIDLHNYGRYTHGAATYTLGAVARPGPMTDCFVDLWARLARTFKTAPGLGGFGLCNEPHDLPGGTGVVWENASRRAAAAIRTIDARVPIYIGGDGWSSGHLWTTNHLRGPWLGAALNQDPNIIFEAHSYFDHSHRGVYEQPYDEELRIALSQGYGEGTDDGTGLLGSGTDSGSAPGTILRS